MLDYRAAAETKRTRPSGGEAQGRRQQGCYPPEGFPFLYRHFIAFSPWVGLPDVTNETDLLNNHAFSFYLCHIKMILTKYEEQITKQKAQTDHHSELDTA